MEKPVNLPVPANSNLPPGLPSHLNIVPSEAEAQSAISGLLSYLDTEDGLELGSLPLFRCPADYRGMHQPTLQMTVRAGLQLLVTDRTIKHLVSSIATDEGVWHAILKNSVVQNFLRPLKTETMSSNVQTPVISYCSQHQSSDNKQERTQKAKQKSELWKQIGKIILEIYKVIVGETMWKVIELIIETVSGKYKNSEELKEEKSPVGGSRRREENQSVDESKEEKLLLSVILATMVVLAVIVLRCHGSPF